jgi:dihydroorotase
MALIKKLLLKNVTICDIQSKWNGRNVNIYIENGRIHSITDADITTDSDTIILDKPNLSVSPGWFDLGTQGGEPGYEHRDSMDTLLLTAAAGGFTDIALLPNLLPVIHSKSEVQYIRNRAAGKSADVHPIGALSQNLGGKDIAELMEMKEAGAVAFSDCPEPAHHGGLLLRGLLYVKGFDGLIMQFPSDDKIFPKGYLHEGNVSTQIGTKGIPSIVETIMIRRDLELLRYTDSKLHFQQISTAESVSLIRQAKAEGLKVTASVSVWNIAFTDEELLDFNNHFKLSPPLREEPDRLALIGGLADGTIDCIVSGHTPLETEKKMLEFTYSTPGSLSLQTAFGMSWKHLKGHMTLDKVIEKWTSGPRKLLGLKEISIMEGSEARLSIFSPEESWEFNKVQNQSLSDNSPLWNEVLPGRVYGTMRGVDFQALV